MGERTGIAWTDHTFNPWWGCQRVSPGCEHCYAETFSHRLGMDLWGPSAGRRFFGGAHWNEPLRWDKAAAKAGRRERVFCASMADVFEDLRVLDEHRARLWKLIAATPNLTWQLVTKRPGNALSLTPKEWNSRGWPPNVWFIFTAEDQERFDIRWEMARRIDAVVIGVSYEPALGPLSMGPALRGRLDWVIVGGESGRDARPFDIAWARSAVEQCQRFGAHVFVKQLGARPLLDGVVATHTYPVLTFGDQGRKHDDPAEWPADLRVREFPA